MSEKKSTLHCVVTLAKAATLVHKSDDAQRQQEEMAKAYSKRGRERGKVNNNAQHNLRILPLKHLNDENTRRVGAGKEGDSPRAAHLLVILNVPPSLLSVSLSLSLSLCIYSLHKYLCVLISGAQGQMT